MGGPHEAMVDLDEKKRESFLYFTCFLHIEAMLDLESYAYTLVKSRPLTVVHLS